MQLELTTEEATNLLALINRAQITGQEAEVAVTLKQKIAAVIQSEIVVVPHENGVKV